MWEYLELSWMSWPLALGTVKGRVMASNSSDVASLSLMYIRPGIKSLSTWGGQKTCFTHLLLVSVSAVGVSEPTAQVLWTLLPPALSCATIISHLTFLVSQGHKQRTNAAFRGKRHPFLSEMVQERMIRAWGLREPSTHSPNVSHFQEHMKNLAPLENCQMYENVLFVADPVIWFYSSNKNSQSPLIFTLCKSQFLEFL